MTKAELRDLINEVLEDVGCGCCGEWNKVRETKRRVIEEIWNEMKKLKHRRRK